MATAKLICEIKDINKNKTILYLNFMKQYSGKINPEEVKYLISSFSINNINTSKLFIDKKFFTSNLFLANKSVIPKIWTHLFSFQNDSNILKYIIANLLTFERDIFYIIKNGVYDILNDKTQIKDFIEFTDKTNFFYDEQSFLWKDLIGEKLRNDLKEQEYKNLIIKIEKELSNIEILKKFSWPEESITKYKEVLNVYLVQINEKIETEKKSIEIKKAENKLIKMRNEVSALKLKEGLEIFKVDIIGKIANLLKRKEKEGGISTE